MKARQQKSVDEPPISAGGIVVIEGRAPLIAVVRRRKDDGWVLPRRKLKQRGSAFVAARREVEKQTGHRVVVQKFLGAISYDSNGRSKIAKYWLMVSVGSAEREMMGDTKTVKWLSLNAAIACLTEPLEQAFLSHIGQQGLKNTRLRLPRNKSRLGRKSPARSRESTNKIGVSLSGRQGSNLEADVHTGEAPSDDHSFPVKPLDRSLIAPNFIRRLFQSLKRQRHSSDLTAPAA